MYISEQNHYLSVQTNEQGNLEVKLTPLGIAEMVELTGFRDNRKELIFYDIEYEHYPDIAFHELMRDIRRNSELSYTDDASSYGNMSEAPAFLVSEGCIDDVTGFGSYEELYYYPDYQITSFAYLLMKGETVTFYRVE